MFTFPNLIVSSSVGTKMAAIARFWLRYFSWDLDNAQPQYLKRKAYLDII